MPGDGALHDLTLGDDRPLRGVQVLTVCPVFSAALLYLVQVMAWKLSSVEVAILAR